MKTYHFVLSLGFEAETEEEAHDKLVAFFNECKADPNHDNAFLEPDIWALDPFDEDKREFPPTFSPNISP